MTPAGIDLHANNMVNVAINGNGKVVREVKLPTTSRSLEDVFGDLEDPVQAVVECTSSGYWLSDWCRANGVALILAHAKMVKAISYAKVKTDKVDGGPWPNCCGPTSYQKPIKYNTGSKRAQRVDPGTSANDRVAGKAVIHPLGPGGQI